VAFKNGSGVTLSDVSIFNPPGSFDPVLDDERYIAFSLTTHDGKPLSESKSATLSLGSTSFNTGFSFKAEREKGESFSKAGTLPVLVTRVGATVTAQSLNGMRYRTLDWNFNTLTTGTVTDGKLVVPDNQPIFTIELTRN